MESCTLPSNGSSTDCFIDVLGNLDKVFYLHDVRGEALVGFILQPDHQHFISATAHRLEPYPRHFDIWDSLPPPHLTLDIRICLRTYHVFLGDPYGTQ